MKIKFKQADPNEGMALSAPISKIISKRYRCRGLERVGEVAKIRLSGAGDCGYIAGLSDCHPGNDRLADMARLLNCPKDVVIWIEEDGEEDNRKARAMGIRPEEDVA